MTELTTYRPDFAPAIQAIWQEAAGDRHPLPAALWPELTTRDPGFRATDLIVATEAGAPVGFALTKRFREPEGELAQKHAERGWIALMAVAPAVQRRGVGSQLLAAAEAHLAAEGARIVNLGESFHHAMPGIPTAIPEALAFFEARGYTTFQEVWDVAGDARAVTPPDLPPDAAVRPMRPDEAGALLHFLEATFPGRWTRDMAQDLLEGESPADVAGLFVAGDLVGFARLHPPGSRGALRWAGFEPGIAALGPIGVSTAVRGRGLGLALLQGGLVHLAHRGAGRTVIDWTTLLDFYGRVGFEPWLCYRQARKELA